MILVSIVGNFHSSIFPIYYEFKEEISTHIVVHDDAFNELLKNNKILQALEKFNQKKQLNINTKEFKIDEDALESINKLYKRYFHFFRRCLYKYHRWSFKYWGCFRGTQYDLAIEYNIYSNYEVAYKYKSANANLNIENIDIKSSIVYLSIIF